jgi:hypothetical protein
MVVQTLSRIVSTFVSSWLFSRLVQEQDYRNWFIGGGVAYTVVYTASDWAIAQGITFVPGIPPTAVASPAPAPATPLPQPPTPPPSPEKAQAAIQALYAPFVPQRFQPLW